MVNAMPRFVCLALSFSRFNSSGLVKLMSKIFLIKHMFDQKNHQVILKESTAFRV